MKDFIPYNESLDLRDLGFDAPCFAFWDAYNGGTHLFFKQRVDYHWLLKLFGKTPKPIFEITNWEIECLEGDYTVLAPTFSQAFRFFREKYNLILDILPFFDENQLPLSLKNIVKPKGYLVWNYYDEHFNEEKALKFDSYEQAELECLRKLIELCKSK